MGSRKTNLICNKFGGIRRKNAVFSSDLITAQDMQNIELYDTGINGGVGIRTTKGNINISGKLIPNDENVINIFESVQQGYKYIFVHTENNSRGTLYLFNLTQSTLTPKIENLSLTGRSTGVDFAQGYSDLFIFNNGKDKMYSIEIGAEQEIIEIEAKDTENREIRGLGAVVYTNRLWCFEKNRLHYSVQANVYDWVTSDAEVTTSGGFIEFSKDITAIAAYLNSIAVFFKDSSVIISGDYPFSRSDDSPGGCANYKSLVFHGTDLYFYDDTKKGIFSFQQIVLGNKTLGKNIAEDIQDELINIDKNNMHKIAALSAVLSDRNEVWFYFPTANEDKYSQILIYDYSRGEWIKRKCPRINCFAIVNDSLCSGAKGKIYQEYMSSTFDGEYISHYYQCSNCNLGSDTTLKVTIFQPRITVDSPYINDLFVKYVKNYNTLKRPKIKKIRSKYKKFLIWSVGNWGQGFWCGKNINALVKIPNTTFKTIQITFYTENEYQDFAIRNLEFSLIKVIQV